MTQPLGTKKKTHNLSGQKNRATSRDKKITQPLDKKNHATSWDKKNHATPSGQQIKQSLRTENHATFRDKKIIQPLKRSNCV